jgi:hypothetical protein
MKLSLKKSLVWTLLLAVSLVCTACPPPYDSGRDPISIVTELSDTRFNGTFTGTTTLDGVTWVDTFTFDGTNKMGFYSKQDAKEPISTFCEIKLSSSHDTLQHRLWDNESDDWSDWVD